MSESSLTVKKIIDASCQEVFEAWTKPAIMMQWFFPNKSNWHAKSSNELKVGGQYKHEMISEDRTIYTHTGEYKEIIPNKKLVFTWNSHIVKNTLVTIEFDSVDDKTQITLKHELFKDQEIRNEHEQGWQGCLQSLNTFFLTNKIVNS